MITVGIARCKVVFFFFPLPHGGLNWGGEGGLPGRRRVSPSFMVIGKPSWGLPCICFLYDTDSSAENNLRSKISAGGGIPY